MVPIPFLIQILTKSKYRAVIFRTLFKTAQIAKLLLQQKLILAPIAEIASVYLHSCSRSNSKFFFSNFLLLYTQQYLY
jgi:hypothetical protein